MVFLLTAPTISGIPDPRTSEGNHFTTEGYKHYREVMVQDNSDVHSKLYKASGVYVLSGVATT